MRLYGSLTVSSVFVIFTITASALPKTQSATKYTTAALTTTISTTISTTATTSIISPHYLHYGRQASPHTSSPKTTTPTAEYARSESSKKDCDCAEAHSSVDDEARMSSRAIKTSSAPSSTALSAIASAYVYSTQTSTLRVSSKAPQIQPMPQSQYYGMPDTTLIQLEQPPAGASPPAIPPSVSAAPTILAPAPPDGGAIAATITPLAASPTQDIEALISAGGQPWHQVTYYECVTWPSEYVHCGWHTPLRMGRNPDPEGQTFVYGAAVRFNGRIGWVVSAMAGVLMVLL